MYKIKIQSCETPEESYVFRGEYLPSVVLACIDGVDDMTEFDSDTFGEFLETLGKAVKEGSAKSWDFSSPESAYTIDVEVEDDDVADVATDKQVVIDLQFRGYESRRYEFPLTESRFEHVHDVNEANDIIRKALECGTPDRYGWVQWSAFGEEFQVREVDDSSDIACRG